MKNNLKLALSLIFLSLFGLGCKKSLREPLPKQSSENDIKLQSTLKTRPIGFQVEQDDTAAGLSGTPLLSLKNTPADTKQFIIIMDGIDRTQTTKALWIATAAGHLKQIEAQGFGMQQKQITNGLVQNIVTFHRATTFKSCKTEVFALDRELTPEELEQLKTMTRETFRAYYQNSNKETLLASTLTTDAMKILENAVRTTVRALERARSHRQKTADKFAEGIVSKNTLNSAEHSVESLEKKLLNLKNQLSEHQKHH